jgi:hypothetical protein
MAETHFADNYADLCRQGGTDSGFQFEFRCEVCGDAWRTDFVPYRSGQASGWIGRASGLLGGVLGGVGNAVEGMAEAGWSRARDGAFAEAVESAQRHFHRCARCHNHVCDTCWNAGKGLCLGCAPDVQAEIEAARVQGEIYGAGEKAVNEGIQRGKQMDVKADRQLVCTECGAMTKGAKFCPECGVKLAVAGQCPACSAAIEPGVKFCPECGERQAG